MNQRDKRRKNKVELIANDFDTDEEVEIPYVKFRFRWMMEWLMNGFMLFDSL